MTAYNTVVQTAYPPQMRAGIPGMISHETGSEVGTWLCATSTGIPFGVAVSVSINNPQQAVIGGANFLGISVIDITQDGLPINPLSGVEVAADQYPQYSNMGIMTRGRCWVVAQADVQAGQSVYYEETGGTFSNSASGTSASGSIIFTQPPAVGDTLDIAGTTVTWVASGATGAQVNVGATLGQSIANLATVLNASADTNLVKFVYEAYPPSPAGAGEGFGANELVYGAATVGTAGNALTVTTTTSGATVNAMAGGTASAVAVTGARWLDNAVSGQIARLALALQT